MKRTIILSLAAFILLLGAFMACFMTQTPKAFWASGAGQGITLAVVRTLQPAAEGTEATRIGDAVPIITLADLDGSTGLLAPEPGRPLLINFWATWCGPCLAEMPLLDAAAKGALGQRVTIIGIATDTDLETVKAHLARYPVSYPIGWSPEGPHSAQAKLGGSGGPALPYSVLIGADGRIAKMRVMGFDDVAEIERWAR